MARTPRPWFYSQTGWWMTYLAGKKIKLARGKPNRRQAEQKLRELLYLRDLNPDPGETGQTVASIIERYLTHAAKHLGERTFYERKHYLQAFAEAHGWRKVAECKPFHLTSWFDSNPQWQSTWTLSTVTKIVHRPFNWAVDEELIEKNPFKKGRDQRRVRGKPRRPMTDDEFQALLNACGGRQTQSEPSPADRFREFLVFLRLTGARPSEASRLTWEQVDCDKSVIIIEDHKTARTQEKPRPRVIPLVPDVAQVLRAIKSRNEPGPFVFRNHHGTPWNRSSLSLRMQRARAKAGLPPDTKLYGLRHAFGTRAIINGVDLKTLAELMGHTTTRMTEHYVHLADQRAHLVAAMLRANDPDPVP
jgi:integrase